MVQDAYTLRTIPQVYGAICDTIEYTREVIEREINSATDNPLIFDNGDAISGGNFHGEPVALVLDFLSIALTDMGNMIERRIDRLVNPKLNDLPPFLTTGREGLNSGYMIWQYTAAALASENKTLAHPASADSIPTSGFQEDHVSMGAWGARKLWMILENLMTMISIEALLAYRALGFRHPKKSGPSIEELFGEPVRRIVEGETKISKLAVRVYQDEQSENLRQMLLAMVNDVRIILVKLADRLHNMRTLEHMPPPKQLRISEETLEIFAPLAHRLGINHIKNELEDIAFYYVDRQRYEQLERQVRSRHIEREKYVQESIALLAERLEAEGLRFELSGRSKHLYSIYRKMQRDNRSLDQIFDLMAIRAILDPEPVNGNGLAQDDAEKAVCYRALGIVHSLWTPIPGRFKDYVAVPKPNGYQSLHTTVIGLLGQPIEVQIRTRRMHKVAEFGVAAHWAYKDGIVDPAEVQKRLEWMKQLLDVDSAIDDAEGFVDAVKTDYLSERVLVFTPAGDVVNLPRGSTPIDFAYQVHTEVGHRTIGARVNGEIVPLTYQLQTGDRVEILTNRSSQYGPSADWVNMVVTRSAKQKIKHYFRAQERQQQLEAGKRMLERGLRRRSLPVAPNMTKAKLQAVADELLNSDSADDLYLALAAQRVTPKQVVEALVPDLVKERRPQQPAEQPRKSVSGVYVDGLDAPANLAAVVEL